jgi:hypothetical protein
MALALVVHALPAGRAMRRVLVHEEEAKKLVTRAWLMFNSLPLSLRDHVEVLTPKRAEEPSEWIKVRHKETRASSARSRLSRLRRRLDTATR